VVCTERLKFSRFILHNLWQLTCQYLGVKTFFNVVRRVKRFIVIQTIAVYNNNISVQILVSRNGIVIANQTNRLGSARC
jgi:hypothetical protein